MTNLETRYRRAVLDSLDAVMDCTKYITPTLRAELDYCERVLGEKAETLRESILRSEGLA